MDSPLQTQKFSKKDGSPSDSLSLPGILVRTLVWNHLGLADGCRGQGEPNQAEVPAGVSQDAKSPAGAWRLLALGQGR